MLAFAAIMVAAGVRMLRSSVEGGGVCELPGGGVARKRCLQLARRVPPPLLRTGFAALVLLVATGVSIHSTLAIVS